jgi:hypothetical protein
MMAKDFAAVMIGIIMIAQAQGKRPHEGSHASQRPITLIAQEADGEHR